jgi:6-phosphogluconolactonase
MIQSFPTLDELHQAAADSFCQCASEAITERGIFRVTLSGGSTPKKLYELISERELDWNRIEWFWGDERNVPHDHADSNYRMVREALLDQLPPEQVHAYPVPVDPSNPTATAEQYEARLRDLFAGETWPQWDLALLGMGDDAHTASLFPGTSAIAEARRWFVENHVSKFDAYRYTLTAPAINSARQRWFLVAGANKKEALNQVWNGPHQVDQFPSQLIESPTWFVTQDAMP